MRSFLLCFTTLFIFFSQSIAASSANSTSSTNALLSLPTCAIACFVSELQNSTCAATNQTCMCTNTAFVAGVTACVAKGCTVKEQLTTLNVTSVTCDAPIRNKSGTYIVLSDVLAVVSGIIVASRVISRYLFTGQLGADDWCIMLTFAVGIPSSVINVQGLAYHGLGQDVWKIGFDTLTTLLHIFYVSEVLYYAQLALVKISILLFYLRLFPGKKIRMLIMGTIGLNIIFGLLFIFLDLFQCNPISYFWTRWDLEHQGTCLDNNALIWSNAVISIVVDIWMLSLPISQLIRLNLHWKKKLGVALMFCVGTFVTIVSILRLTGLVSYRNTTNPSWDYYMIGYWSTIEIHSGIICSCMPSLRILLVRLLPRVFGSSSMRSEQKASNLAGANSEAGNGTDKKGGIMFKQEFTVQWSQEQLHDEANLVQLQDIELTESKPRSTSRGSDSDV